jgi:hypothetical protein
MVFSARTRDVTMAQLIEAITGSADAAPERRQTRPVSAAGEELLRVENVTVPEVVEDASFVLRRGDLLGIAGLVGAGRTELMRLIFGADRPARGHIYVNGREVKIRSPRDAMRAGIVLLPDLGDAPFQSADIHLAQGTYDSRLARHTLGCRTQGRVQNGGMEPDPLPNGVRSATAGGERRTNECEYDAPAVPNPTSLAGVGEIGQGVHECAILLDVHRVPPAEFGRSTRVYLMN